MSAVSLYVTASRMIFQSLDINESGKWRDINQLISLLRQSLTCCVCGHLLNVPFSSTVSTCQHHICEKCLGGRIRLKPSCSFCKDHSKFSENIHLRILLQSYSKLCRYINSTGIPNKWGSMPISTGTNSNSSSASANSLSASHGIGTLISEPTNFYQLIDEGANLVDTFNYSPSSGASALNHKESIKENSGTNVASGHPSEGRGCKSNGDSKSASIQDKSKMSKILNSPSVVSNCRTGSINGSNAAVKVNNGTKASPLQRKVTKPSSPDKRAPSTDQVQRVPETPTNQINQQTVNLPTTKLTNNLSRPQDDSLTITGITSPVTSVSAVTPSASVIVAPLKSHVIPDPSSKVGKILRLPAALSISAIRTTSATTANGQTKNTSTFVVEKKGTAVVNKTLKKTDDNRISFSLLPSGQLAIATSNLSALRNGTSISVPTSSVKLLTTSEASSTIQAKSSTASSSTLPLGFTCVATDSTGNQVNSNLDQATIIMTPNKMQTNQLTTSTPVTSISTPSQQQFISANAAALKSKVSRRGCRCGLATPNPGKLTCCGQRCPCYVDGKGCYDCKCRGCRNPRKANPDSSLVVASSTKMQPHPNTVTFSSNLLTTGATTSTSIQSSVPQLISIPSNLALSSASQSNSSRSNSIFLSSNINHNTAANGLTLLPTSNSVLCNPDPLTLPLLEDDPLRSSTVDDDKLEYSMMLNDD